MALSLWAERLAERRAYFLTRAEIDADRADDFVKGRVCLREEYDKEGMYEKLRDHARLVSDFVFGFSLNS